MNIGQRDSGINECPLNAFIGRTSRVLELRQCEGIDGAILHRWIMRICERAGGNISVLTLCKDTSERAGKLWESKLPAKGLGCHNCKLFASCEAAYWDSSQAATPKLGYYVALGQAPLS